jgi:type IV secretory pathway protease TraF
MSRRLNCFLPSPVPSWRRHPLLATLVVVMVLSVGSTTVFPHRLITLNLSPSVAPGFYVATDAPPETARLVEFRALPAFRSALPDSRFHPRRNAFFLKPIAAGPGDHIDTTGSFLLVNGVVLAPIQTLDSLGRPLPVWRANRVLHGDEYFVFSARVWNSLDSRHFGPICREDIVSVREPLLTWGGH